MSLVARSSRVVIVKIRQLQRACRGVHVTFSVSPAVSGFSSEVTTVRQKRKNRCPWENIPRTITIIRRENRSGADCGAERGAARGGGARSSSIFSATQVNPRMRPYSRDGASRDAAKGRRDSWKKRETLEARNDTGMMRGARISPGGLISARGWKRCCGRILHLVVLLLATEHIFRHIRGRITEIRQDTIAEFETKTAGVPGTQEARRTIHCYGYRTKVWMIAGSIISLLVPTKKLTFFFIRHCNFGTPWPRG